jgi:hypothetical protein
MEARWHVRDPQGKIEGPFEEITISARITAGYIDAETMLSENGRDFQAAREFFGQDVFTKTPKRVVATPVPSKPYQYEPPELPSENAAEPGYGVFILCCPLIAIYALIAGVWSIPVITVSMPLTILTLATWVSSAILVHKECVRFNSAGKRLTAQEWFALVLLLWPIGLPIYMFQRKGMKNLFLQSAILSLSFSALIGWTWSEYYAATKRLSEAGSNLRQYR